MDKTRLDPGRPAPASTTPELRGLGEYRFLRRIGEGGMGEVYLGYDEGSQQHVAVKVLPEYLDNIDYIARFHREARSGAVLNHANIVRTLGANLDKATNRHYLVMEYVDGDNVLALLEHKGRFVVGDVVRIGLDIARALEHAHSRNVIHRDIKPDNILISRAGVAKLLDFGLAKRTDEASHLTSARQGFGTTHYMPYEQALSARQADGRSDIYALGATLYHLVTGKVPFDGDNHLDVVEKKGLGDFPLASSVNADVPRVLDHILGRMMARLPEDRYQTASELIVDLERSRLAPDVLSFADPELARRDPWLQTMQAANAQPTRPDLCATPGGAASTKGDVWLLRYTDSTGKPVRSRSATKVIAQQLREGTVPTDAEVCRAADEGFLPITFFPEFDVLTPTQVVHRNGKVLSPASPPPRIGESPPRRQAPWRQPRWVWLLLAGCLAAVLALIFWYYFANRP